MHENGGCKRARVFFLLLKCMETVKRGRKADFSGLETTPQECQLREVVLEMLGENRGEDFLYGKKTRV